MVEPNNVFDFNLSENEMEEINNLDSNTSQFFSHYDPKMVEWFASIVVQRRSSDDISKEKKNW